MNSYARNKRVSRRLEKKVASDIGGRWSPSSGALGDKGDVRLKGRYRIEHKFTRKDCYTLKLDDLNKITSECFGPEEPVFIIEFVDGSHCSFDKVVFVTEKQCEAIRQSVEGYIVEEPAVVTAKSTRVRLEYIQGLRVACEQAKARCFMVNYNFGWSLLPYAIWMNHANAHRAQDT